jgi:hypothetical protein
MADADEAGDTPTIANWGDVMTQLSPKYVKSPPTCPATGVYALLTPPSTINAITVTCGANGAVFAGHGEHP